MSKPPRSPYPPDLPDECSERRVTRRSGRCRRRRRRLGERANAAHVAPAGRASPLPADRNRACRGDHSRRDLRRVSPRPRRPAPLSDRASRLPGLPHGRMRLLRLVAPGRSLRAVRTAGGDILDLQARTASSCAGAASPGCAARRRFRAPGCRGTTCSRTLRCSQPPSASRSSTRSIGSDELGRGVRRPLRRVVGAHDGGRRASTSSSRARPTGRSSSSRSGTAGSRSPSRRRPGGR